MKRTLLAILLAVLATHSYAEPKQPVSIKEGFLSGNTYYGLSEDGKRGYAIGFLEGIFVSPMFDAPKKELQWIERCTVGMTDRQVAAIFDKYLRENPARWHEQMNILAWVAMKEGCAK